MGRLHSQTPVLDEAFTSGNIIFVDANHLSVSFCERRVQPLFFKNSDLFLKNGRSGGAEKKNDSLRVNLSRNESLYVNGNPFNFRRRFCIRRRRSGVRAVIRGEPAGTLLRRFEPSGESPD